MSGDKCEDIVLAQYAHKYVKVPRDGAQSRPISIYRGTPSNRAVIHWSGSPDASIAHATDVASSICRSDARHCVSERSKANGRNPLQQTRLTPGVCASDATPDAVQYCPKPRGAASDASNAPSPDMPNVRRAHDAMPPPHSADVNDSRHHQRVRRHTLGALQRDELVGR
jgi:hypothetical protein